MRRPYRNYAALEEAHKAVDERANEPLPTRPAPAPVLKPDAAFLARHQLLEQKVAYADALQEQLDRGLIDRGEKAARLSRFDQGDPTTRREARLLCDARELAAAARVHEDAEKTQLRTLDGPER